MSNEKPAKPQPKRSAGHHDVFFKSFYSNPKYAVELFRLIFSKEELKAYDWKKLKAEKDTLQDKRADLVFSLPLKNKPHVRFRIFILLEHKSQYDPQLFTQLLYYQTFIHQHTVQSGRPSPVIPVLFYHGKNPWKWTLSFQEAAWGDSLSEIPVASRKNMINYTPKLLNAHDPKIKGIFEDRSFQSRGALRLLGRIWSLKLSRTELKETLALFGDFSGKQNDLIVNVADYLESALKESRKFRQLWEQVEKELVEEGIFQRGGFMDIRDHIREKGIQEGMRKGIRKGIRKGRQEGRQEVVLNMLKEKTQVSFISKVTGLSKDEIKKLKNGSLQTSSPI